MGQSQLLMIVLAVIIVGIAVTVGITQFGENAVTSNRDAIASDCQSILSKSQGWYRKPVSLGGGGFDFTGLDLVKINMATGNDNGDYQLNVVDANNISCVATGKEKQEADPASGITVTITYNATDNSMTYTEQL
jgi:hypothetical protein